MATAAKGERIRKQSMRSSLRQTEKRRMPPEGGTQTLRAPARRRYERRRARTVRSATAVPGLPDSGAESERWALKQLGEEGKNLCGRPGLRQWRDRGLQDLDQSRQR